MTMTISGTRYLHKKDCCKHRAGYWTTVASGFRPTTQISSAFGLLKFVRRDELGRLVYLSENNDEVRIRA